MKAQRESRCIALIFNFGTRWGWEVNATPRPLYPSHKRLGWLQGRSGQVQKMSPPIGIPSSNRPAPSDVTVPTELYRPT